MSSWKGKSSVIQHLSEVLNIKPTLAGLLAQREIETFDELIISVELFDVYQGNKLGKDKKSLAFHVSYQADDRTLINEEVDQIQNRLVEHSEKKYEAQIRNF